MHKIDCATGDNRTVRTPGLICLTFIWTSLNTEALIDDRVFTSKLNRLRAVVFVESKPFIAEDVSKGTNGPVRVPWYFGRKCMFTLSGRIVVITNRRAVLWFIWSWLYLYKYGVRKMNNKKWYDRLTSGELMDMESVITVSKITDDCLDAHTVAMFRHSAIVAIFTSHLLE